MAMNVHDTEGDLVNLGRATRYPPTPDLEAGFWRSIGAGRQDVPRGFRWNLVTFAASAAVGAGSFLITTVGPVRDAAADLFDSIDVFSANEPVEVLPVEVTGDETTLDAAAASLGREIEQPTYPHDLSLNRVVLQNFGVIQAVVLDYSAPAIPSFSLFVTNANIGKGIAVDRGMKTESVTWPGTSTAYWFAGPHRVEYRSFDGSVVADSVRQTRGQTLVWERGGFVYRTEGDLEQDDAVRIAQSLSLRRDTQ